MPERQPTHHHCSACVAYGVHEDCGYTLHSIAVDSEDRAFDARTLHEAGCAPVKGAEPCGHGADTQSVPAEAVYIIVRTLFNYRECM